MLDAVLTDQLRTFFKDLSAQFSFEIIVSPKHPKREELTEILNDVANCSPNISCEVKDGEGLQFILYKNGQSTRIKFRSTPNGHEFSSLILAILNCDGKGKNLPEEPVIERIKALHGPICLTTYVNLTCLTCSELVQSLNVFTTFNDQISHEIVDGGIYKLEVLEKGLQGLPTVFANGKLLLVGRASYGELINKLEERYSNC